MATVVSSQTVQTNQLKKKFFMVQVTSATNSFLVCKVFVCLCEGIRSSWYK